LLVKSGAEVFVMMTHGATGLVQPQTFAALTGNPVGTSLFDTQSPVAMKHTELGLSADLMIVAPATANLLGRFAHGLADDIVSTTLLVTECPVLICPAMNSNMWENPQVQNNIDKIEGQGRHTVLAPDSGELACGVVGSGRLPNPQHIVETAERLLTPQNLSGRRVLITGGPTREYIDPVRFLSNPATGTLAIELARAATARGAETTLVLGPTGLGIPRNVQHIAVTSADDMCAEVLARASTSDVLCMSAAVADWKPEETAEQKEHKGDGAKTITLVRTPDILQRLQGRDGPTPLILGFAAETEVDPNRLRAAGRKKMARKGCDLLYVNTVFKEIAGFGSVPSNGILLGPGQNERPMENIQKNVLANVLMDTIADTLTEQDPTS
jgi:phosphopantothenoylcysteine decarboxylase/phosphopantothenate--cysteine ligase